MCIYVLPQSSKPRPSTLRSAWRKISGLRVRVIDPDQGRRPDDHEFSKGGCHAGRCRRRTFLEIDERFRADGRVSYHPSNRIVSCWGVDDPSRGWLQLRRFSSRSKTTSGLSHRLAVPASGAKFGPTLSRKTTSNSGRSGPLVELLLRKIHGFLTPRRSHQSSLACRVESW